MEYISGDKFVPFGLPYPDPRTGYQNQGYFFNFAPAYAVVVPLYYFSVVDFTNRVATVTVGDLVEVPIVGPNPGGGVGNTGASSVGTGALGGGVDPGPPPAKEQT